jgi:oxygen-independent coproporphyrinogen-3 oxidase
MNFKNKYNIPAPRYTSYPTVPFWQTTPTESEWKDFVRKCFIRTNKNSGISLYIHLPFCESLCTYCACNTRITVNHQAEIPYIGAILSEWRMYLNLFNEKPVISEIHLGGGTPTFFSPGHLHELIGKILQTANICEEHDFSFEGHPGNTTAEHLQVLYDLGFRRVSFGIQDFDLMVQEAINRHQSFEEVDRVVKEARRIGYQSINFDLVYGLPFQKLNTIHDTIINVIKLKPDRIAFYSYAHVPWLKPGQRKFSEKDLPLDYEKRKLYQKGLDLFTQSGYKEIGMDHFALTTDSLYKAKDNKKLHRNFMGYTSHSTELLIGLGVSAISDVSDAFAQNEKKIEIYYEKINTGIFPFCKGHILSGEDKFLRKQILNIMCLEETTWEKNDVFLDEIEKAKKDLFEAEVEGFIEFDKNKLIVTKRGKPYLRNICMAFDARYRENKPKTQVFSTTA